MSNDKELMIINETTLKDKIYTIRGQKVMLDFDLAEIYGFSVSAFNQQVKRNISRFDEDFMFDLNKIEMELLSKSQNVISIQSYGAKEEEQNLTDEEILILDGEPFKADEAYQKIYRNAKSKIMIIDDYISSKTLHHLAHSKETVKVTAISDNSARPRLSLAEYNDFVTENPGRSIVFLQSMHRIHDRYIVLDEGSKDMKIYHCGASSKDAGNRITTITRISDIDDYKPMIKKLAGNPALILS